MMSANIANPVTGEVSDVLKTAPNADQTNSLRLTTSLANLLNLCAKAPFISRVLLQLTTNEQGQMPADTAAALANLARDPSENAHAIYFLASIRQVFTPALAKEPNQWSVTVKLNDTGRPDVLFGGPANVDWDSWGYAWITNNVTQGTRNSTKFNIVLRPDGKPANGSEGEPVSPFDSGGLLGTGWGVSVDEDDRVWFGNFGWGSPKKRYYPSQTLDGPTGAGTGSVSQFDASDGSPISPETGYFGPYRVQAIAPDAFGNIWMASLGDRNVDGGSGVWVFRDGDANDAVSSLVSWQDAPFGIAPVPNTAAAWATFSGGLAGQNQSSIARYELNHEGDLVQTLLEPIGDTLKVVAVDHSGNAWFASQGTDSVFAYSPHGEQLGEFSGGGIDGPWGVAVDGGGNIWVSNFGDIELGDDFDTGRLSQLCGANPAACQPGLKMGDPISPETGYTVPSAGEQVSAVQRRSALRPWDPSQLCPNDASNQRSDRRRWKRLDHEQLEAPFRRRHPRQSWRRWHHYLHRACHAAPGLALIRVPGCGTV